MLTHDVHAAWTSLPLSLANWVSDSRFDLITGILVYAMRGAPGGRALGRYTKALVATTETRKVIKCQLACIQELLNDTCLVVHGAMRLVPRQPNNLVNVCILTTAAISHLIAPTQAEIPPHGFTANSIQRLWHYLAEALDVRPLISLRVHFAVAPPALDRGQLTVKLRIESHYVVRAHLHYDLFDRRLPALSS